VEVFLSLGLNDDVPIWARPPEPRHKSAGLAFGLSLLIPGAGQFYCGKIFRGGMTLAFWLLALLLTFAHLPTVITGQAVVVMLVLWIFSFLDAYYTAIEINQGQDDQVDVQNPRVAVTLNLLTAGFGYFYLGERTKGIVIFVVMQVSRFLLPSGGFWGFWISLSLFVVQIVAAHDAYSIARRQVKESLGAAEATPPVANAAPASRLPAQVPIALACVLVAGFVVLGIVGLALGPNFGKRRASAKLNKRPRVTTAQAASTPYQPPNDTPIEAVDFLTSVQDVQREQRKAVRTTADIPYLKQDARMLTTVLGEPTTRGADSVVAHYYRGIALTMTNFVHEQQGEAIDVPGARTARADFDRIIASGTVMTYVPEITTPNVEYWAGVVARNQLHDETAAYAYWEKCAWDTHAGCMNNLASAKITGEGGQKVDILGALNLHSTVYDSGVRYRCAGALSAMNIAYINYFTGVRRPGDDELQWTKKADELLDTLETRENNRNVCHRADSEVDEFLLQLSLGHRDDTVLQDAMTRLDDDSNSVKAVIQFISGAIDERGFDAAVQSDKSKSAQCSAYFDGMWYSELHNELAPAKRFHQRLVEIGKFYCGEHLVFAEKFKL